LEASGNFTQRTAAGIEDDARQEAIVLAAIQKRESLETRVATDRAIRMLQGADAVAEALEEASGSRSRELDDIIALLERVEWRNPETNRLRLLRNAFD
jgi:hypothetical protein